MATFAPQLQPMNIPDWTNNSRPISEPKADTSKGLLLSTIGDGIASGAGLAEQTAEQYLTEKVHAGVDALRDSTTLAYQNIRNSQITGTQPSPQAVETAGFSGSLSQSSSEVPDGLQQGLDKASTLSLAKRQGGANDTLYTGQLNSLAKELRAQYPGHKDFIDEQIAKVSGMNPANAYMNNILTDINRSGKGEDVFMKQLMSKVADNWGDPAVQKWWLAVQHNIPGAVENLTQQTMRAETQKWQVQQWQAEHSIKMGQRDETNGALSDDSDLAKHQYEIRSAQIINSHINPVLDIPGLSSPQTVAKLIQDSQEGRVALTPEQHNQLLSSLVAARNQAATHLQDVSNNEGYAGRIKNPADVSGIANRQLEYFDRVIDSVKNKDYGTLFEAKRRAQAMQDQTTLQANSSDLGEWLRQSKVFQDYLGPQWNNYLDSLGLKQNKLKELQSFVNDTRYRAVVPDDVRKDGVVASMYDDLQRIKQAKLKDERTKGVAYDSLADNVDIILKANEKGRKDIAANVVDYMFDPAKNAKVMSFFGKDFTDDKGVLHKGNFSAFDTLTAPRIVDAIDKIGDRDAWGKFKDWSEMSFKNLFQERLQDLNKIQGDNSLPVRINWDSDNHQIHLEYPPPKTTVEANYIRWAKDTIDNPNYGLNRGLKDISYIHDKEGGDTNDYLMQTLLGMGYSPNDKLKGDNLPQRLVKAVAASQDQMKSPEERIKEVFKRATGQ